MKLKLLMILVMSIYSMTHNVFADGWFYQPTMSTNVEADSNKRLRRDNEKGVVGVNARADIKLSHVTEISEVYIRGALHSVRYDGSDDRGVDTDDQLLYAGGRWTGERSQFSIDGEFLRQSSQLTELRDSGFFEDIERRVTKSIVSQYSYTLFEATQVFAGLSYTEVDFPNTVPVSLTEYSVEGVNAGMTHSFDEKNSATISVFHSEYEADTFLSEVESTGANIRYNKIINEIWQAFVGAGYRKSNFKNLVLGNIVRDDDTGESYEFGATRETGVSSFNIAVSNELQPSASGNVNERLEFSLGYRRSFSPRLATTFNADWFENKSINNNDEDDDREFWQLTIGADYRITPQWYVTGQIRHREQKFTETANSGSADSDAVIIGVRYSGQNERI